MTVRVYVELEAFSIVRLNAGSVVDNITLGNIAERIVMTARAIVDAIAANDMPSFCSLTRTTAEINATAVAAAADTITTR